MYSHARMQTVMLHLCVWSIGHRFQLFDMLHGIRVIAASKPDNDEYSYCLSFHFDWIKRSTYTHRTAPRITYYEDIWLFWLICPASLLIRKLITHTDNDWNNCKLHDIDFINWSYIWNMPECLIYVVCNLILHSMLYLTDRRYFCMFETIVHNEFDGLTDSIRFKPKWI